MHEQEALPLGPAAAPEAAARGEPRPRKGRARTTAPARPAPLAEPGLFTPPRARRRPVRWARPCDEWVVPGVMRPSILPRHRRLKIRTALRKMTCREMSNLEGSPDGPARRSRR